MKVVNVSIASLIRNGWNDRREFAGTCWRNPDKAGVEIWISGPYNHAALFIGDMEVEQHRLAGGLASLGLGYSEYLVDENNDGFEEIPAAELRKCLTIHED